MIHARLLLIAFAILAVGQLSAAWVRAEEAKETSQQAVPAEGEDATAAAPDSAAAGDNEVASAVRAYWGLLVQHPEGTNARRAYALLLGGDAAAAKVMFQDILTRDEEFAPAHFGSALAIFREGQGTDEPAAFVQQATYHAERASALHKGFAGPHKLLGRIRLTILENYDEAVAAYVAALVIDPAADPATIRQLSTAYLKTEAHLKIDQAVIDSLEEAATDTELYPVLAAACASQGQEQLAVRYYGRYFVRLPVEERRLYDDISLIATKKELKAFKETEDDPAARREFLVRFWAQRDPDLLTPVNERRLEHYRRVWYSRIHFGRKKTPWGRRGEVYVRYGEPDHRATSGAPAAPMSAAVEQIKERIAWELYDEDAVGQTFRGPVYPIYSLHDPGMDFPAELNPEELGLDPFPDAVPDDPTPVIDNPEELGIQTRVTLAEERGRVTEWDGMTFVKWESWVYTDVAGGIEIVFTSEGPGTTFDYAPVPQADFDELGGLRRMSQLVRFSSGMVMKRSVQEMPEFYLPGGREAFLDFYYDHAAFRGPDGTTRLELYFGLSPKNLSTTVEDDDTLLVVGCAVGLFNVETGEVLNRREELRYRVPSGMST
ncbi:MAG: GWxTD domain-containing protein, partial [Gemmatimonadetes bacterium]|nr:GWxTD domain-containing protein [Gemmatimonadota bacterium]